MCVNILEFSYGNIKQIDGLGIYYNDMVSKYRVFNGVFLEMNYHDNVYCPKYSEYSLTYLDYNTGETEVLFGSLEEIAKQLEVKVEYISDNDIILYLVVWFKYLCENNDLFGMVEY